MSGRMYQSRFGATRPIAFAQYAAETVCARLAKFRGESLAQRFWEKPAWKRTFLLQVMYCNGLTARFPEEIVAAVLRSPEGLKVCTLRNPALTGLLEAEVLRREQSKTIAEARKAQAVDEPRPIETAAPAVARPPVPSPGSLFDIVG